MKVKPLRAEQPVFRGGPPLDGDFYRWLASLATAAAFAVPPKGIVMASLSSAEVSTHFDATGLGNNGGKYEGWAICNGNNGAPNLTDRFVRVSATAAGATGGSDSSAHTHSIAHGHDEKATDGPSETFEVQAGVGATVASEAHTHNADVEDSSDNSGAASVTDNRPAFYTLVALMRLEVG